MLADTSSTSMQTVLTPSVLLSFVGSVDDHEKSMESQHIQYQYQHDWSFLMLSSQLLRIVNRALLGNQSDIPR